MGEEINARFIFEILGRPKEYVEESLKSIVQRLDSEKSVKVTSHLAHKPKKVEKTKDLFTTFAEVETEIDSLGALFGIIFAYFPSNIEIVSPRNIKLRNEDLNDLMNILAGRLHGYDSIAKKVLTEREIVFKKLEEKGVDIKSLMNEIAEEQKNSVSASLEKNKKTQKKKP